MDYTMNHTQPPRDGNRDPQMAPHGVFRCAGEQRWVAIAVRTDAEWERLARIIGHPELATQAYRTLTARKSHEDDLEALVTAWTSGRSPEEVTRLLQEAGIPAFPSMSSKDLSADPHLGEAGFFVNLDHPEVGVRQHIGIPWRLNGSPCAVQRPAPCLGEHTNYVMTEVLNYSPDDVDRLKADGVLK